MDFSTLCHKLQIQSKDVRTVKYIFGKIQDTLKIMTLELSHAIGMLRVQLKLVALHKEIVHQDIVSQITKLIVAELGIFWKGRDPVAHDLTLSCWMI